MTPIFRIAAIAAALVSVPASAEWISLNKTAEAEDLFDPVVISRDQSRIKLWTLTNYSQPMTSLEAREYLSEKTLTTLDCKAGKSGAEQVMRFSGRDASGEVIGRMETPLRMTSVRPGSVDEGLLKQMCQ